MVTKDDSRCTYEYDKHYIVYPNYSWVHGDCIMSGGKLAEEGFEYYSGNNTEWLTVEELRNAIKYI